MLVFIIVFLKIIQICFTQKSYDGAQLLRLQNFENTTKLQWLLDEYEGSTWKHTNNGIDVSFEQDHLEKVKNIITTHGGSFDVLIPNLKQLIENNQSNITKRSTTQMDWKSYQSYNTIIKYLISRQNIYPNIAKAFRMGTTLEKRKIILLRISNNVATNKAIFIDGGIHAREWISPASVTYIIHYLLSNWNTLPKKLKNKTWYFAPLLNPDGYEYSRTTDRLWRKNRKRFSGSNCVGVDLNRNFDIDWNSPTQSLNKCTETFRGPSAFSEIESKAIKTFLMNKKKLIKGYLTFHSYGQYILWPYGYTNSGKAPNASKMKTIAITAASKIKALTGFSYTTSRSTLLGLISGASDDWAKKKLGIPYTYTVELRDSGNYGFLLPSSQIIGTGEEAVQVAKTLANAI